MSKVIFSISFLFFFNTFIVAQTEILSGKIIKKEWSKTIDSYCAGGSEYYVLVQNDKTETILDLSRWRKKKIEKSVNQTVTLKGVWQSNSKKNDDPYSQHPTTPTLCRIFVVKK
ncbi:MAG: hypothetical protein JNL70_01885 [Saprospiraceae bacterium]|nr:hypothetical protein [Saprospiraceae bacterium]